MTQPLREVYLSFLHGDLLFDIDVSHEYPVHLTASNLGVPPVYATAKHEAMIIGYDDIDKAISLAERYPDDGLPAPPALPTSQWSRSRIAFSFTKLVMDPSQCDYPPMKSLTTENITQNVNLVNSGCQNPRVKFLIAKLVDHLHDYARETRLSMKEWGQAIDFLTKCGQTCTPVRQELILLSDVLGLSALVDAVDHPKSADATEGTVLGPFHTHDANHLSNGDDIGTDPDGTPLLFIGTLRDRQGSPIREATVDVWETDSHGFYDVQYANRDRPHGRGVLKSDEHGKFFFQGNVPVSYPVPVDGPVGDLLRTLRRHPYRPAHIHFMVDKEGFDHFISALTLRGDPYENHDPVFGVKHSLVVDLSEVQDEAMAQQYGVAIGTKLLQHEFVLESAASAHALRQENARTVMEGAGHKITFYNDLPVPAVD